MSYAHRHGEECRKLDEQHIRNAGPMRKCTGLIRRQDGVEAGSRMLFLDVHEAWRVAERWSASMPERRTVEFYESWA